MFRALYRPSHTLARGGRGSLGGRRHSEFGLLEWVVSCHWFTYSSFGSGDVASKLFQTSWAAASAS